MARPARILLSLAFDPSKLRVLAQEKCDENWQFRAFLKGHCDSDELDEQVFEVTKRVWANIDCKTCANCCKHVRPTFGEEDVERISRRVGLGREEFVETYLEEHNKPGDENPWITRSTPCPFLKDNLCSVYEDRPANGRGYPYLYEPEFVFRLMGMIDRTFTCPIVYEVMEELKQLVGYRDREKRRRKR